MTDSGNLIKSRFIKLKEKRKWKRSGRHETTGEWKKEANHLFRG